jgi:hypothetical protein
MCKVPSLVKAEILFKVRCPSYTLKNKEVYPFFMFRSVRDLTPKVDLRCEIHLAPK